MTGYRAFSLLVCSAALAAAPAGVTYSIETVAGGTYCRDGWQATAAYLWSPEGIAIDTAGNIYISDSQDNRVRKIDRSGVITTVAGNGHGGFGGDGGPAAAAQLNMPYGLAFDAAGNLYIADFGNHRVRRISPGGVIQTVAGGGTANPGSPALDAATAARLNQPRDVVVDSGGNLYISDFGDHRVYEVQPDGLIKRIAGTGLPASITDEPVLAVQAPLNAPAGLAVDRAGTLYIADSGNHRVRKIKDELISTVQGLPTLNTPTGLALDANGGLYVADRDLARVVTVLPAPGGVVAGVGTKGYSGDGGLAISAELNDPRGLAFGPAGALHIADSVSGVGIIRVVRPSGLIETAAGGTDSLGDLGPALWAHLSLPSGVAVGADGGLYIADQMNDRVRKVSRGAITTVAGTGRAGSAGDGGPGTEAELDQPYSLALDGAGSLWILEGGKGSVWPVYRANVRQLNPAGIMSSVTTPPMNSPQGLAVDGAGSLYIADTSDDIVCRVSVDGTVVTVAGNGVPGYSGDGGPATGAMLDNPTGLAVDGAGNLYVVDSMNHAIRKIDPQGTIRTIAGTGVPGFGGDGGPAVSAQLQTPSGLALDAAGNLYIADRDDNRIRKVAPDGTIATIAGTGAPGWNGDGGPALLAEMDGPVAVAVDSAGNVFIADSQNNVIRKLTPIKPVAPEVSGLVSSASLLPGPVAPGEIVTLFGTALGPDAAVGGQLGATGLLATKLADTEVFFDAVPAALLGVGPSAIYLQVPYEVAGRGSVAVEVRKGDAVIARVLAGVAESAPALYADQGTGQAAALNEDGKLNSAAHPARQGSLITLYATGEGQTQPAGVDGKPAPTVRPTPVLPVSVTVGGQQAKILFAGSAAGYAGLMELDVRLPLPLPSGDQAVVLTVGSAHSQPGVTVAVR